MAPGDEVYGLIGFDRDGAAAEYVTMPAAELAQLACWWTRAACGR